jgi:alkanesulfonate monooxygenase SsuD/methylene tetrahydromethanopterin reductase-like flavin-dependent oxidoreductase (luciferase family)
VVRAAAANPARDTQLGVWVSAVAHPDAAVARRLIRGVLASTSRFSVMHGTVNGPIDDESAAVLRSIHGSYMTGHAMPDSAHSAVVDDHFVEKFGIAGTPDYCVRRIRELIEAGATKVVFFPVTLAVGLPELDRARRAMTDVVLPAFRSSTAASSNGSDNEPGAVAPTVAGSYAPAEIAVPPVA